MNLKSLLILLVYLCVSPFALAQSDASYFRKGNDQYNNGKYNEAEIQYRKGLEKNKDSWTGQYNLADALYKQEKYKEASLLLDSLAKRTKNPKQMSSVYHNLGNSLLREKAYEESIDAFKKSLKLDPEAEDSRYNLSYAYKMLKKQQEKQQQQQQQQKQEKKEENKEQKQEEQKKQNINQQEAERMLDALDQQEKQLRKNQQKKEKREGVGGAGKDW
jgi:Ca-activated chloride channel family protein